MAIFEKLEIDHSLEKLEIGHFLENFEIGRFLEKFGFGQFGIRENIIFKSRGDFSGTVL